MRIKTFPVFSKCIPYHFWGPVSQRSITSGAVGLKFNPLPGHGWCSRQASLTLAVYSVQSFNMFLVLKKSTKSSIGLVFIVKNHADYKWILN